MTDLTAPQRRILVVSNRLPFTVREQGDTLLLEGSSGGLVSGLSAWLDTLSPLGPSSYTWIGWPGITVPELDRPGLEEAAEEHYKAYPVYLSDETMNNFYEGFCNTTLWPLFHYFPSYAAYHQEHWETYRQVNEAFCDAVMQQYQPGDLIWIHDYHLMLLPRLLRERLPNAAIGFFLHIPFPSFELLRVLPTAWRDSILTGLLGADLIGFHANDYCDHFLRSIHRFLGYNTSADAVTIGPRFVRAKAFPMGIDFVRYAAAAESPQAQKEKNNLREMLGDAKIILSIDRLDYTKGIINRLEGYSTFLEQNPEWQGKVVLALVVTPSRIGAHRYQETKQQIEALVGNINGRFGRFGSVPVSYQYRFLPLVQLAALYSLSDVALVAPLRDGMNLISKEYLACRTDGTGVLVLSVLAGAAEELREAVLINPNSSEEIAAGLKKALQMPVAEQIQRNRVMQERLRSFDVTPWAQQFIRELVYVNRIQQPALPVSNSDATPSSTEAANDSPVTSRRRRVIHQDGLFLPRQHSSEKPTPEEGDN